MNKRLSTKLLILLSLSALLACPSGSLEAKRRKPENRRRRRSRTRKDRRSKRKDRSSKKGRGDFLLVALVYRNDVSQFVDLVREFKKQAPYKFLDLGFSPHSKAQLQRTKNLLEKGGIDGGLFVGPASHLLLKTIKRKPRKAVTVILDPTVEAPNSVSLGPSPQAVIQKIRQVCPKRDKATLIASSRSSSYAKAFVKAAKKNGLRHEIFEASTPKKTILALTKRAFEKKETVTLAPGTKSLVSPVLKALVFLERLRGVPLFSFCRRHVALGVFMVERKSVV